MRKHVGPPARDHQLLPERNNRSAVTARIAQLAIGLALLITAAPVRAQTFEMQVIDPEQAGDCKAVGDLDNDGLPDLIVGGMPHEKLTWYHNPDWKKSAFATAKVEFSTDCTVGDVDGDGDIDIVVPDGPDGRNILWFENKLSESEPGRNDWPRHEIGTIGGWGKDVAVADFDHDGRMDVAVRSFEVMIFFQTAPNVWSRVAIPDLTLGEEGMSSGDVDGNGFLDLVVFGAWVRNPGKAARTGKAWRAYKIGPASPAYKAAVGDIDGDGHADVLFSSSEHTADVAWFKATTGDPTGAWTGYTIFPQLERAHTLRVADLDGDGHNDVVVGQMHTSHQKRLMYARNVDGRGQTWQRVVIDRTGLHNGVVADVNKDGRPDIFGANWTGNPPVRLWLQKGPFKKHTLSTDFWTPLAVTRQHRQTFGLGFGDVDGDGRTDIASGAFVYRNPGGDLSGAWRQHPLPEGMQAFAVMKLANGATTGVIAQRDSGDALALFWLEPADKSLASWTTHKIGSVPKATHTLGAQGYRVVDLVPGGKEEIVISSGDGIYYFELPAHPATDPWPRTHVSSHPSDEGIAVADIDGDGHPDIAATTGASKRVEWYRNPGKPGGDWQAHSVGEMEDSVFPDRVAVADLNGDGQPDIIATEENGKASDAKTYWWEHPKSLDGASGWERHLLATQASTHGLDAGDIDQDGDMDLITGEHRGDKRTILWLNDGKGRFTPKEISRSFESHLGSRLYDLDGDGDLDVISIAWDDAELLWIARNDAISNTPLTATTMAAKPPEATPSLLSRVRGKVRALIQSLTN